RYYVGTSHDGGQQWADSNLPFEQGTPSATVSLSRSASVRLARNASTTVALLTEQFFPDLHTIVAARTAGHENVSTRQAADGFDMVDVGACVSAKGSVDSSGAASTTTIPGNAGNPTTTIPGNAGNPTAAGSCDNPPVLGTISWSDIGLNSAADLNRQQMLVSTDGTHWDHATAPATGFVTDLVASGDGFMLLADQGRASSGPGLAPGTESTLMRSTDAQSWTGVATPAGLGVQAIAGDRIIGIDAAGAVQTSADGGATWTATTLGSHLPAGSPDPTGTIVDAGPLGFAVVVTADANPKDATPGFDSLLFSTDGITWSTSDLAAAGAPAGAYPTQVLVGADHIGVDYEGPNATPNGPTKITTLLATPTR
ncbi:MAG: Photosynthesis system assembly factor, partial [Actinomycetota bacterium]|nr:Photosynthesis system assembly factor [Actinomycetota bacterium]